MRWIPCLSTSVILWVVLHPLPAAEPGNEGGLFVVANAPEQFAALKHHGEALGWRNPENLGAPDPSSSDHYQGIVRYPRLGEAVFYITQLDDDDGGIEGGYLNVIRLGTRTTSGERLRSNLQRLGSDTEEVTPPADDTWVRSLRFDGSLVIDDVSFPAYRHPGGMAIADDILLMGIDQPSSDGSPTGHIVVFELRGDALDPIPIQAIPLDHSIDNLALTDHPEGGYLLWVNGDGGKDIKVYRTDTPDLRDPDLGIFEVQDWDPASGLLGADWPTGSGAHQGSTFLREPDGTLYLIGTRHPGGSPFTGDDFADLYRVSEPSEGEFVLTLIQTRNLFCVYDGGGGPVDMRICNLAAAGSAYASPSGELIIYSSPHDDEDGFDTDIVRMGEFRHRDVNREDSPLRLPSANAGGPYTVDEGTAVVLSGIGGPPADRPWVELYDDEDFEDRSIVVDFDDSHLLELSEFDGLDDFGDSTTSIRWRCPPGLDVQLFDDDDFGDRFIVLRGTGETQAISNVGSQDVVPGVVEHFNPFKDAGEDLEFSDKTSSLRFVGSPPAFGTPVLEWDLDGDGLFGETGVAALRGDEVGSAPSFSAAALDGPVQVVVTLRVTVPGSAGTAASSAVIDVRNVPPAVQIDSLGGGIAGLALVGVPVALAGSFQDVAVDTHTASVDWDDGTVEVAAVDQSADTVAAGHTYATAGNRSVTLTVTDDDDGVGTANASLQVFDASGAVQAVIDAIDVLLAMDLTPEERAALIAVRNELAGNNADARNGVLDKLAGGESVAALRKIEKALEKLVLAEALLGLDFSTQKLLLALAAQSVAQEAFDRALAAGGPTPRPGTAAQLAAAQTSLEQGIAAVQAGDLVDAVRSFIEAAARADAIARPRVFGDPSSKAAGRPSGL